jgi:NAD(P)-dependent dehydrogenase (short-subunit alcohol dehydrogenase family)
MAEEYQKRGWSVVGTVRGDSRTPLHDLADGSAGRVGIEHVDINFPDQIAALRDRLAGRTFNVLFMNSGVGVQDRGEPVGEVSTDEFVKLMVTNALSPMRVIEALQHLVPPTGVIGVMSSGLGSVANNINGVFDVYRGSKAALNTYMRSFAARHPQDPRGMVLMAPGWVRTDLGGPDAPLGVEDSVPNIVNVLTEAEGKAGLRYLDYLGRTVPW